MHTARDDFKRAYRYIRIALQNATTVGDRAVCARFRGYVLRNGELTGGGEYEDIPSDARKFDGFILHDSAMRIIPHRRPAFKMPKFFAAEQAFCARLWAAEHPERAGDFKAMRARHFYDYT